MISIIIPAYNEEKDILECLESLHSQSYKNFEIIIVDDSSTDNTIKIVNDFAKKNRKIKILKQQHKGPGAARNLASKSASGDILVLIDADMTFKQDYLEKLIKPLEDKKIIGTTHELELVKNTNNIWSRCWGRIRVSKEEAKNVKIFRAIRKDRFLELGGVDTKYGYADDQTFWFKYKKKPVVAKGSVCYHKNPETLSGVFKQSRWIGASHNINLIKFALMIILSLLIIPLLSINKCYKNKDFVVFPAMLVFMIARYLGNLTGYWNKLIWKKNFR